MILRRLVVVILFTVAACAPPPPTVDIDGLVLVGERMRNGVNAFRGVPFAEPPVRELRWQLPRPYAAKPGTLDATTFAPACMQTPRILEWYGDMAETFGAPRDVYGRFDMSEDCLYLNVWTPAIGTGKRLPVVVYVHGGSNSSGWSYEPNYTGRALAGRGVVVVTIAYRLGVFGFFSHPLLEHANYGLWDQVLALEWIRDNIAAFGGDPGRVMLFGESAGAQDVLALMASDLAKPLFHRAVLQSTAGFGIGRHSSPTLEDERARGVMTASLFKLEGEYVLRRLRAVPPDELLRVYTDAFEDYYHSPAVDGVLLERPVWDVIQDGELSDIPFIIGTNADEWYESTPADVSADDLPGWVAGKHVLNTDEALETVSGETDVREAIDRIDSAEYMLCPSQYLAARQTALNGNAWVYYFSRIRDSDAGRKVRAYHGAELPYVFGTHDPWMTTTEADVALTRTIMSYWANMARDGNPNGGGLPDWPAFSGEGGMVMNFGDTPDLSAPREPVLCRIFAENVTGDE